MDYFKMKFAYPGRRLWKPQFGCEVTYSHFAWTGHKVTGWDPSEIAIYEEPFIAWDHAPAFLFRIVSSRVKELFEAQFPDGLQFLPVRLQKVDGTGEVLGYFGLHLINVVDCVSVEHSGPMLASTMVLAKDRLPDSQMFAVERMCEFVVSSTVMNAIKAAKFTGFAFEAVKIM